MGRTFNGRLADILRKIAKFQGVETMEEAVNRGASPSKDSTFLENKEILSTTISNLDERALDSTARQSLTVRTPGTKKAKRVRFFRNGDKFYTGVVMAVTPERYRSFDSLASDLTRALVSSVTLPNGVRAIYTMDGRKIQSIGELEDGKCYVVSGQGEAFKKVEYSSTKVKRGSSLSGLPQLPAGTGRQISAIPLCVKARIVTLIRHGTKPRKVVRLLLNKRNAPSLEHVMEAITEVVKLDTGAVRKVYTLSGQQVTTLEQFFDSDDTFVAYGPEKPTQEDFELDFEESKCVQSFRRCPWISSRQNGPMPRMPRKSGRKVLTTPQVRTPSPSSLILPQPLRLHYAVGHVIGDGNFAVVRHCIHKTTGVEYAMKIVDKYKCQGKETMLASEVAILRQVCHPNIISLIAEQETIDQLFLVMELVKGGDLFDAIAAATKFSEAEASVMISHLTSALAYLHSHSIVHRDVKPENLLVEMDGSHVRCLKLGDFGLAQVVRENLYTVCGTPTYVAPEILAETGYGLKIDVWAAGVILYILLCGFPPFVSPENEQEELFERILSGQYEFTSPYWDTVSDSAKQLISNMLQAQPELRFSAEDVLDHPWLSSFVGGKQTSTTTTAIADTTEQYGDQQRKPMRLATFEFDYKKQRKATEEEAQRKRRLCVSTDTQGTRISSHNNEFIAREREDRLERYSNSARYEADFVDGNYDDENGPTSLSQDCLQDIQDLGRSMHNLIDNLKDNNNHQGLGSSIADNCISAGYNYHSSCSLNIDEPDSGSIASVNKRNGNSLNDIRIAHGNVEINSKGGKRSCNLVSMYESDDVKNFNAPSSSSDDSIAGSSSNDIETSDSFVNIQLAQLAHSRKSSSTQSMESTDSFENIGIYIKQYVRYNNMSDPNESRCKEELLAVKKVTKEPPKKRSEVSRVPRLRDLHATDKKFSFTYTRDKGQDPSKSTKDDLKNMTRLKRFSYIPQYSSKRSTEYVEVSNSSCTIRKDGRRFSSTDELRNDKQKISKVKRFSLYYTPQPVRKTYEGEAKAGNNRCKNSSADSNSSCMTNKKKEEISRSDQQKNTKNRKKNVVEASTLSSRNRFSRQAVHVKSSVLSTTCVTTAGRTK